ncbi:MAG: enoyl-CoA hydratase/isomerase family protein [Sulfolobales archaeon]
MAVKSYVDDSGVMWARISRVERRNAWSSEVSKGFIDLVERISRDRGVIGLVVTGEGDYFSAGVDLREILEAVDVKRVEEIFSLARRAFEGIAMLEKPVVVALNGPAFGIAVELLHIVDYVVASRRASLAITGARLGLVPPLTPLTGWRNIGVRRATYLAISGRSISAGEALSMGLVDEVVDQELLEKRSREVVKEIASSDPDAVASIKRAIAVEKLRYIEEGFKLIAESAMREETRRRIKEFLSRR